MSIPGERRDKSLPAVAKTAAAVANKWYRYDPTVGNPQDAILVADVGGDALGVSENANDAVGDTFSITVAGLRFVDAAASVVVVNTYVMSDASGDTVAYTKATEPAKNLALGLAFSTTTGGAGEQVSVEIFEKPLVNPDLYPG